MDESKYTEQELEEMLNRTQIELNTLKQQLKQLETLQVTNAQNYQATPVENVNNIPYNPGIPVGTVNDVPYNQYNFNNGVDPNGVQANPGFEGNAPMSDASNSVGTGMSQGTAQAAKVLVKTSGNGHNVFGPGSNTGNTTGFNGTISNGFINKAILTLIAGFGLGVIATATYIFMNIGKFSFTL